MRQRITKQKQTTYENSLCQQEFEIHDYFLTLLYVNTLHKDLILVLKIAHIPTKKSLNFQITLR